MDSSQQANGGDLSARLAALEAEVVQLRCAEAALRLEGDLTHALASAETVHIAMENALDVILQLDGLDMGGVYLVEDDRHSVVLVAHRGLSPAFVEHARHFGPSSPQSEIVRTAEPVYFSSLDFDEAAERMRGAEGFNSLAVVPVSHGGEVVACFNLASRGWDSIPETVRRMLELTAARLGAQIRHLRIDEALTQSEARFRELVERLPEVVFELDPKGNLLFLNQCGLEVLGYTQADLDRGLNMRAILSDGEYERARKNLGRIVGGVHAEAHEYVVTTRAGREIPVLARSTPVLRDGRPVGARGIWTDMSEQKSVERALRRTSDALELRVAERTDELARVNRSLMAEAARRRAADEALEEAEARFRLTFESAADAIFWIIPETGKILNCNPAAEKLMGQRREAIVGRRHTTLHPPEESDYYGRNFNAIAKTHGTASREAEILTSNGQRRQVDVLTASIVVSGARVIQAVFRDVTALREAEQVRNQLFTAMEQAAESMMVTDAQGRIQYVNPAFEKVTGYTEDEVVGKTPRFLKSGRHGEAFYREMWSALLRGEVWHGHLINRCKDGALIEEEVTISPVAGQDGVIVNFVALKHNVTERMSLERQLRHAQRMESIGTLAGGIAHDFRNSLSLIVGHAEIALGTLADDHPAKACVTSILRASGRATEVVQQILTFSRRGEQDLKPIRPEPVVAEAVHLLRASLPATTKLSLNIQPDCGFVLGDPGQLHQVVMNLCTNACQAIGGMHGVVTVSLKEETVTEALPAQVGAIPPGCYVCLSVCDTGPGMDQELAARVFDPFFTTKPPGKGTGLGLSTVHGIVLGFGGAIRVETSPKLGAEFHVYLPRTGDETEESAEEVELVFGQGEHVLVVDDDAEVLNLYGEMARALNYQVTTCASALEALRQIARNADGIRAVITDQIMPDMTGMELVQELGITNPDLPVVLVTGVQTEPVTPPGGRLPMALLIKPVTPRSLSAALQRALNGTQIIARRRPLDCRRTRPEASLSPRRDP